MMSLAAKHSRLDVMEWIALTTYIDVGDWSKITTYCTPEEFSTVRKKHKRMRAAAAKKWDRDTLTKNAIGGDNVEMLKELHARYSVCDGDWDYVHDMIKYTIKKHSINVFVYLCKFDNFDPESGLDFLLEPMSAAELDMIWKAAGLCDTTHSRYFKQVVYALVKKGPASSLEWLINLDNDDVSDALSECAKKIKNDLYSSVSMVSWADEWLDE